MTSVNYDNRTFMTNVPFWQMFLWIVMTNIFKTSLFKTKITEAIYLLPNRCHLSHKYFNIISKSTIQLRPISYYLICLWAFRQSIIIISITLIFRYTNNITVRFTCFFLYLLPERERRQLAVYYTSPKSFIITFCYLLA